MKSVLASVLIIVASLIAMPAFADSHQSKGGYRDNFDVFIDDRGRHYLVDPRSGEVVGRANRNAKFTRRDKRQAEAAYRRKNRRKKLNKRLGSIFDVFNKKGRDGKTRFKKKKRDRVRQKAPAEIIQQEPLPEITQQEEIARLPELQQSIQTAPTLSLMRKPKFNSKQMMNLQVFLDRAGFSPGVIDGRWGSNVAKAAASWKESTGSSANLGNAKTLSGLVAQSGGETLTSYTITKADVAGPYLKRVPTDYAEKSELEELSYLSIHEMLSERFHMSQGYLRKLNKGKRFGRAGTTITVVSPGQKVTAKVHYIIADKSRKQIRGYGRNGKLITAYPATIGSAATPSPTGTHSVARIAINPEYTYNPKKNFQQGENDKILRIPPGPNGPVGSVWIALSKPTYGIHGTPNPDTIGKTNSHGCIRLTNWDARELAKLVRKGVTVEFVE
ncbi:MAG: L,D-transpeptidase [Rhizobiaceae bacterium]